MFDKRQKKKNCLSLLTSYSIEGKGQTKEKNILRMNISYR